MTFEKLFNVSSQGISNVLNVIIKNSKTELKDKTETEKTLEDEKEALKLKVEALELKVQELEEEIAQLKAENLTLSENVEQLTVKTKKNSSNSSKPPSTDGLKRVKQKNNRENTGKPSGGQLGHVGKTLEKVSNPDKIIEPELVATCDCGHDLEKVVSQRKTRQEFDLPKIEVYVKEYVVNEKVCPTCGKVHKTEFPPEIKQPTQYGDNIRALAVYLTQYQLIPLSRAVETIYDITGHKISEGTILNMIKKASQEVEPSVEIIKEKIINSDVVHFDETGVRVQDKTQWLHTASTNNLTYYEIHKKRGAEATKDIGILPAFTGTAVHDHWKPYYTFADCTHAECNAHILRALKGVYENCNHEWAKNMIGLLVGAHREVGSLKEAGATEMPEDKISMWLNRYHQIIEGGIEEDKEKSTSKLNKKGKAIKSESLKLLLRMQEFDMETLFFIYDFNVPFDNNLAELDIRMQKLKQKISGCFRTQDGAKAFCKIRSYISTTRKNGLRVIDAIKDAFKGKPFVPA